MKRKPIMEAPSLKVDAPALGRRSSSRPAERVSGPADQGHGPRAERNEDEHLRDRQQVRRVHRLRQPDGADRVHPQREHGAPILRVLPIPKSLPLAAVKSVEQRGLLPMSGLAAGEVQDVIELGLAVG